jgi:hypothetical protein
MSSTEPVRLPERSPSAVQGIAPTREPLPAPRKARFTIKVKGMIPT